MTQSAVSHALASLESELGVTLLERNRKGVAALTSIGEKIIPHARALLAQAEAIEQEAKAAQGETAGKLRLGSIQSIVAPQLLAGLLNCFQRKYPDMEVVLFEGAMQEVGEWIEKSVIDVGFVVMPAPGMTNTLITTDELCILIPGGHRLQEKKALTFRDLHGEGFVMEKSPCSVNLLARIGFEQGKTRSPICFNASDSTTVQAMVREGLGITLVPRQTLPKKLDGIVALPLEPRQPLELGLAVKDNTTASAGAKLFVQTALEWIKEQNNAHRLETKNMQ